MPVARHRLWRVTLVAIMLLGCQASPSKVATLESQNRALAEQNRAQLAEIENLKIHARGVQDKLLAVEAELARLDRQVPSAPVAASDSEPAANPGAQTASGPWTPRPN